VLAVWPDKSAFVEAVSRWNLVLKDESLFPTIDFEEEVLGIVRRYPNDLLMQDILAEVYLQNYEDNECLQKALFMFEKAIDFLLDGDFLDIHP
jgi:hypothetical protein